MRWLVAFVLLTSVASLVHAAPSSNVLERWQQGARLSPLHPHCLTVALRLQNRESLHQLALQLATPNSPLYG